MWFALAVLLGLVCRSVTAFLDDPQGCACNADIVALKSEIAQMTQKMSQLRKGKLCQRLENKSSVLTMTPSCSCNSIIPFPSVIFDDTKQAQNRRKTI